MKAVMEGVGVSPATFCLFDPLLRAQTFHPRKDASSSSVTRRPGGMGSLGWRAAKWAAILYNQTVVVHWGLTYLTPAVSGVPNKGDKIKVGPEEGGNATSPLHSRGSPTQSAGTKSKWAQKRAEMLHHPCILGGPQTNGDKIRIGCLNPAFWGTHKWAEMLRQPCFLRDTQQRGQKQSTKKTKKNKNKKFPMMSLTLPVVPVECPHWGSHLGPSIAEALLYH